MTTALIAAACGAYLGAGGMCAFWMRIDLRDITSKTPSPGQLVAAVLLWPGWVSIAIKGDYGK